MVSFISKFLFTATVTAPTFLSLGLIGVIKDSTNYFQLWDDMLENKIEAITSFAWSIGVMINLLPCQRRRECRVHDRHDSSHDRLLHDNEHG